MTKLRQQMDDDMLARGLADRTRESYLWGVTGLARFYRRSPDQISDAEVQAYLVHLIRERQRAWSTCNAARKHVKHEPPEELSTSGSTDFSATASVNVIWQGTASPTMSLRRYSGAEGCEGAWEWAR